MKKGFALPSLLALAFVLLALPVALYLSQTTTIFKNKAAEPVTILFQDSFNNLTAWQITKSGTSDAKTTTSPSFESGNALLLDKGTTGTTVYISKNFDLPITGRVTIYFYDDLSAGQGTFFSLRSGYNDAVTDRIALIGVKADLYPNTYYARVGINDRSSQFDTQIKRTAGWHKFETIVTSAGSYLLIDGFSLQHYPQRIGGGTGGGLAKNLKSFNRIVIASTWTGLNSKSVWDNLSIETLPPIEGTRDNLVAGHLAGYLAAYEKAGCNFYNPSGAYKGYNVATRTLANTSVIAFALYKTTGNPVWKDVGLNCLNNTVDNYSLWGPEAPGTPRYALTATTVFNMAAFLWLPQISDPARRQTIKNIVTREAEETVALQPFVQSGYITDSKSETNSWEASALAWAAAISPEHPRAQTWREYSRAAAYHTFTTSDPGYGGAADPVLQLKTQTLRDNLTMDNHGFPQNAGYVFAGSIQGLSEGSLAYYLSEQAIPNEFLHNLGYVWTANKNFVNFSNLLYQNNPSFSDLLGDKDELGLDSTSFSGAYALLEKRFLTPLVDNFLQTLAKLRYNGVYYPPNGGPWVCARPSTTSGYTTIGNFCVFPFNFDDIRLINSAVAYREAMITLWNTKLSYQK